MSSHYAIEVQALKFVAIGNGNKIYIDAVDIVFEVLYIYTSYIKSQRKH